MGKWNVQGREGNLQVGGGGGFPEPSPGSLVAMAGAVGWLVAVQALPAGLTVAHGPWCGIGLADATQAVELPAGLAAWHHPWLHPCLGEVLQLVVDVQVSDATVEARAVEDLPQAEGIRIPVHWHPWSGGAGAGRG